MELIDAPWVERERGTADPGWRGTAERFRLLSHPQVQPRSTLVQQWVKRPTIEPCYGFIILDAQYWVLNAIRNCSATSNKEQDLVSLEFRYLSVPQKFFQQKFSGCGPFFWFRRTVWCQKHEDASIPTIRYYRCSFCLHRQHDSNHAHIIAGDPEINLRKGKSCIYEATAWADCFWLRLRI